MQTNKLLSRILTTGTRLVIMAALLLAVFISSATPAAALPRVLSVAVGAQSGTLTSGTPGSVTYLVTVSRGTNQSLSANLSITGLPAGATGSFAPSTLNWPTGAGGGITRTSTLTVSTTAGVPSGATTFTVSAVRGGTPGDNASGTGTLTILASLQPQIITFGALANKVFGDPDFNVSATASSGLPVSFAAAGNCTVGGSLVQLTGAGSCTITASQAGNTTYLPAPNVPQSFAIAKADQTITFGALPNKSVIDPDFTVSASASSGLVVSFAAAGECSVTGSLVHLSGLSGSCVITASQSGNSNYNAAPDFNQSFQVTPLTGIDLYAVAGTTALAGQNVTVWGYSTTNAPVTAPGGPTLFVNQGDTVTVVLHNQLSQHTALLFQGQTMIPDTVGAAPGSTKVYSFVANRPGTYLYEAGMLPNAQHQVAMGLYGALVVRPLAAGQAYASSSTAFDDEAVLVLSDIDPVLNNSANPATFDMRNYAPKYFLINGKVYPETDAIPTASGSKVLLRYINAGLQPYSMSLLGLRQTAIATDGSPFTFGRIVVAETIAPGQTADMIASIPTGATAGTLYALYDANLFLHNNKANNTLAGGFGGMLTFLTVAGTPPTGDMTGPAASGLVLTATSVDATISDASSGGSNISAAEFFINSTGANGTGTAMVGSFGAVTVNVSGVIFPALSGTHTVYVHGMDAAGNWGPFLSKVITVDITGPTISALSLLPNPSNGTVNVALSATANDTDSGGSNIAAAEYTIDGGAAVAMAVSPAGARIASLNASILSATINGLSNGTHVIAVRGQDSLGNWGANATINLVVDKNGPSTSNVLAAPNPNNGMLPINSSTPAVRVSASFNDALSKIVAGEGFIDTVGANGTGFIFLPTDGLFNTVTENGYVNIPLTTINALSEGNHTIYVHGKDAAGNWGSTSSTILVIDKTSPTISSVTLTPSTILAGEASITLNVTAADAGVGLNGGQYWIDGTATPPTNPTTFVGTSVVVNTSTLAGGTHSLYVRMQDSARNWSVVATVTLNVVQGVNDNLTIVANGAASQVVDVSAPGLLANDQPQGAVGLMSSLASVAIRTSGTGTGTVTISCPSALGTAATPAISGNTICTNGAYRVTLNGTGNNANQRTASKLGTFQFTYTLTLNGVTTTTTVTITVN